MPEAMTSGFRVLPSAFPMASIAALPRSIIILPDIVCGVPRGILFGLTISVAQPSETVTVIAMSRSSALTSERASTKHSNKG